MMGRSYVIDHCVAAANYEEKQKLFKIYDSECLRMMSESLSAISGMLSGGQVQIPYMSGSVLSLLEPDKQPEKKKELTAEEVIADIMADLGAKEVETE